MKKTACFMVFFSFFIFFFVSSNEPEDSLSQRISTQVSAQIHLTLWQQIVKACKLLAKYTIKSKPVHGIAIGVLSTGVFNLILKATHHYYKTHQAGVLVVQAPVKYPPASFIAILLAAIHGAYLSSDAEESFLEIGLYSLLVGLILGAGYTVWREIKEKIFDDEEQFGLIQNSKRGLKQAVLCSFSFITSYYATKMLETLDY